MKGIFHPSVGTELSQTEWESPAGHDIASGTSFPDTPTEKDLLYRTDEHKWYIYNGTCWVELTAAADGGAGLTFTELAGGENREVSQINTWEDWDLSAIIPAGTKAVLVEIYLSFSSNTVSGARKNGSTLNRIRATYTPSATVISFRNLVTEVDDNRIIEIYGSEASSNLTFSILGYWA